MGWNIYVSSLVSVHRIVMLAIYSKQAEKSKRADVSTFQFCSSDIFSRKNSRWPWKWPLYESDISRDDLTAENSLQFCKVLVWIYRLEFVKLTKISYYSTGIIVWHNKNIHFLQHIHWRIQGGSQGLAPPPVQILSFSCSFRQIFEK